MLQVLARLARKGRPTPKLTTPISPAVLSCPKLSRMQRGRSSPPCLSRRQGQLLAPHGDPWSRSSTPSLHLVYGGPNLAQEYWNMSTRYMAWENAARQMLPWPYHSCDVHGLTVFVPLQWHSLCKPALVET